MSHASAEYNGDLLTPDRDTTAWTSHAESSVRCWRSGRGEPVDRERASGRIRRRQEAEPEIEP